jgi:DNA-binding transcriptional LysR family regulator
MFVHLFLGARLPEFLRTYPELKVVLNATNERKDVVKEAYDVAIRVGHLEDSTLMMKRLSIDFPREGYANEPNCLPVQLIFRLMGNQNR